MLHDAHVSKLNAFLVEEQQCIVDVTLYLYSDNLACKLRKP